MIYAALATVLAGPAQADEAFALPSGLTVFLQEVLEEGAGDLRVRYVAEGFDPARLDPELLLADMMALCQINLAAIGGENVDLGRITVSIADRAAEFGVLNTDVRQSFEAFTIADGTCIWEAF
ncbi:hypothetical protein SAMN05421666_2809 [Roseovarius nanhaiticus]|uniref:Acetolactate synthase n=1 Tax=Roseovarius nanhaiticus TaxID=573024 RepID=A0A1N7HDI2_9RHOB|nr:DUF6497 family protein [Roseovarius nanhaiticus]SEL00937.1 hypothetical protein SAMN05216208_2506 [Roseovarius nanhaiticus]SIS22944.1 hypothetical protein SAMN05421666_2809 [Roseovarius nanhaiticus]